MRLYRAMSEAEYRQLMRTRTFQAGPNQLGGKFFAEQMQHARRWGEWFGVPFRVMAIELPERVASQLRRFEHLDGIGPARFAELAELAEAVILGEATNE